MVFADAHVPVDVDFLLHVFPERGTSDEGLATLRGWLLKLHDEELRSTADLLPLSASDAAWTAAVKLPVAAAMRLREAVEKIRNDTTAAPTATTTAPPSAVVPHADPQHAAPTAEKQRGTPTPKQIDVVVVDVSRSMKSTSDIDVKQTREDVSKIVFHALIDGLLCLEEDHLVGLISFGADVNAIDMRDGAGKDMLKNVSVFAPRLQLSNETTEAFVDNSLTPNFEQFHTFLGRLDAMEGRTRLYDAIAAAAHCGAAAADRFAALSGSGANASRPAVRVFALTDGEDNASAISAFLMASMLRELNVTLDAFPMVGTAQLLQAACKMTGGLCVTATGTEQAMSLFQDERLMHLPARQQAALPTCDEMTWQQLEAAALASKAITEIQQPTAPKVAAKSAADTQKAAQAQCGSGNATGATKRIGKELQDMNKNHDATEMLIAVVNDNNLFECIGAIAGPDGSPFAGRAFRISVGFPQDYPFKPPRVRFESRMVHPNINANGAVCLDILKDHWSPALTIAKVFQSLRALLSDPNLDDPLDPVVAQLARSDPSGYAKQARDAAMKNGYDDTAEALYRA
jgi:ubiquitin-conjugating enzyme E2 D/E